jgi:hypothetical protein
MRKLLLLAVVSLSSACGQPPTCHDRCLEWADEIDEAGYTSRNLGFAVARDDLCTQAHSSLFDDDADASCEACEAALIAAEGFCAEPMCGSAECRRRCAPGDEYCGGSPADPFGS